MSQLPPVPKVRTVTYQHHLYSDKDFVSLVLTVTLIIQLSTRTALVVEDFVAADKNELSIRAGEVITVVDDRWVKLITSISE